MDFLSDEDKNNGTESYDGSGGEIDGVDIETEGEDPLAGDAVAEGKEIDIDQSVDAYNRGLKKNENLTLMDRLSLGVEKSQMTGVTIEQAEELEKSSDHKINIARDIKKELMCSDLNLSGIKLSETPDLKSPEHTKADGFQPDRGEMTLHLRPLRPKS